MIVLGVVLLVLTELLDVPPALWTVGIILLVIGVVFWILGALGRTLDPRRHYW